MKRNIFILIPALAPTGPVKGAYAIANALADEFAVTLVTLKPGAGIAASLDYRVKEHSLAGTRGGVRGLIHDYRSLLEGAGGRANVISMSLCFSADIVNLMCRRHAVVISSVRGNLLQNYRMDYGYPGFFLAVCHLVVLRWFDNIVAMNDTMAAQIRKYTGRSPSVIGNFIDELPLEKYRSKAAGDGPLRFVFLATLSMRKRPMTVLDAISILQNKGYSVHLDVVGDGPLRKYLERKIQRLQMNEVVTMHGHLSNPYGVLAQADAFVLPSLSEGVSRAGLEALFLGVPCVLRDVDGNSELITSGENGILFYHDEELAAAMVDAAMLSRSRGNKRNVLLPTKCRQSVAGLQFLKLLQIGAS